MSNWSCGFTLPVPRRRRFYQSGILLHTLAPRPHLTRAMALMGFSVLHEIAAPRPKGLALWHLKLGQKPHFCLLEPRPHLTSAATSILLLSKPHLHAKFLFKVFQLQQNATIQPNLQIIKKGHISPFSFISLN